MPCLYCGADLIVGKAFCHMCGKALEQRCGTCGETNPAESRFCGHCGTRLPATADPAGTADSEAEPWIIRSHDDDAERRQLTVMFCDLAGYTALSLALDPEELRDVVQAYQSVCTAAIDEYAGYMAQYLGDGVLAYFGYPVTLEHEAERAVRAGLGILEGIERLNEQLRSDLKSELSVRVSLHTGIVVIGKMGAEGRPEHLAVGSAPNVAARLQALAEPNTLIISSSTRRLLPVTFRCSALGAHTFKGIAEPIEVYRVLGESDAMDSREFAEGPGAQLIGRKSEFGILSERWQVALSGRGQAVFVCGEPGIGKSNLVRTLMTRLREEDHSTVLCRCEPHSQNSAFHPIIQMLQRMLNFYSGQPASERLDMLDFVLKQNDLSVEEIAPLFADLLELPAAGRYEKAAASKGEGPRALRAALVSLILQLAEQRPLLFIAEDLHWADPSTLEVIGLLLDQIPQSSLLVLLTHRPIFQVPWAIRSYMAQISMNRLPPEEASMLVQSVAGKRELPEAVLDEIIRKTDGVPVFIEELTRNVLESGLLHEAEGQRYVLQGPLPALAIPASLQDSLMARLDRLSPEKELAQLGAALGHVFSHDLIAAVSALPEDQLNNALRRLQDAELLYRQGQPPRATYVFKHVLIQEAAYESLLRGRRQQYHEQIANVLEARFTETTTAAPELLAHHLAAAGLPERAAAYWGRAGERASSKSTYREAAHHFSEGLQCLETLPQTPQRLKERLALLVGLGTAHTVARGYLAPEAGAAFQDARKVLSQIGASPYAASVFTGLFAWHLIHGDLHRAREVAAEMLQHARETGDEASEIAADVPLGLACYLLGELTQARTHLEQSLGRDEPGEGFGAAFMGQDLKVVALCYRAHVLWALGSPDAGVKSALEAIERARNLAHPYSLAFALFYAASLHHELRDYEKAAAYAGEVAEIAEKQEFRHWEVQAQLMRGAILAGQGLFAEAGALIERGIHAFRSNFGRRELPSLHLYLVEALLRVGAREEALYHINASLEKAASSGETLWTAEMWRLKGETIFQADPASEEAEHYIMTALGCARRSGARSLQLRALLSLAKVWKGERRPDAQLLLRDVISEYPEGTSMADLQEARHLAFATA